MRKERRQAQEQGRQHAVRLEATREVSRAVAGTLDIENVASKALEAVLKASNLEAGCLRYVDEKAGELALLASHGLAEDIELEARARPRLSLGQSIEGTAVSNGIPVMLHEVPEERGASLSSMVRAGYRTCLVLPLRAENRVVGTITGFSTVCKDLVEGEIEMLVDVGNIVGMAVSNAWLFRQVETSRREWVHSFDSMSDCMATIGLDFRIQRCNEAFSRMVGIPTKPLIGRLCYEVVHMTDRPPLDCPMDRCRKEHRTCEAVRQEPHLGNRWLRIRAEPVRGPEAATTGVLHIIEDITQDRRQRESRERVYRFSSLLSKSLRLEEVLDVAVSEVAEALKPCASTVGIALMDGFGERLQVMAARGQHAGYLRGREFRVSELPRPLVPICSERPEVTVIEDLTDAPPELTPAGASGRESFAYVPLASASGISGILFLYAVARNKLDFDCLDLLQRYATQTATAIENSRLCTETDYALRRRKKEMKALTAVLSASTTRNDLDSVLQSAVRKTCEVLEAEQAAVYLLDSKNQRLDLLAAYQEPPTPEAQRHISIDLRNSETLRRTLEHLEPVEVPDVTMLPEGFDKSYASSLGVQSYLAVPVRNGGKAAGVMFVGCLSHMKRFSTDELHMVQAMADHLASIGENARLREHSERERETLEAIITSMSEGLIVIGHDRSVRYVNRAAQGILDLRDTLTQQPLEVLIDSLSGRIGEPEDWQDQIVRPLNHGREPFNFSLLLKTADGRDIDASVFSIDRNGDRLGAGIILRDVTREREVDRMKSEFVSVASHELRTPMTSVFGFAELLLSRCPEMTPAHRGWVENIHRESMRLNEIVEDLLNVSRIESGRLSLVAEPVALMPLVSEIVVQFQKNSPKHMISVRVPDTFPSILGDKKGLHRVLFNLLDNAIKYSPKGGPVSVEAAIQDNMSVISITDRGIGIPDKELPRLFTRFHRVQRPETGGLRGTGLGLYVVKSLVERMDGSIRIESRLNEGTTVYVHMPLAMPVSTQRSG